MKFYDKNLRAEQKKNPNELESDQKSGLNEGKPKQILQKNKKKGLLNKIQRKLEHANMSGETKNNLSQISSDLFLKN